MDQHKSSRKLNSDLDRYFPLRKNNYVERNLNKKTKKLHDYAHLVTIKINRAFPVKVMRLSLGLRG
jgi:hypothetical protein